MRNWKALCLGICLCLGLHIQAWAQNGFAENVVGSVHFAGAANLAGDTNFAKAKAVFGLKSSADFQDLALNRFATWLATALSLGSNADNAAALRPLLGDLLTNESVVAMGDRPGNFILAIQLDAPRSRLWQDTLRQAFGPNARNFQAGALTGQRWDRDGHQSFWMIPAVGWLLVGGGQDLQALQSQYLTELGKNGRPVPPLGQSWMEPAPSPARNWLEADLDWPRLTQWMSPIPYDLKPARTQIAMATKGGYIRMKATVTYPQPLAWKFTPWRVPTNLVFNPLASFTTGQDLAALMTDDEPLAQFKDNPLAGQFYAWAMGVAGMPFQTFAAWPVDNAKTSLNRLAPAVTNKFNPLLAEIHSGKMVWTPATNRLLWGGLATFLTPMLEAAPATNGEFLLVSLFPQGPPSKPTPKELLDQFVGSTNLVYYDWELTSLRLQHWRILSAMLPIFPKWAPPPRAAALASNSPAAKLVVVPIVTEENWLNDLTNLDNTVTQITRTAPNEVTVERKSPFALTALELVELSHWLSGVGSPGINPNLLPPPAKVTGPGAFPGIFPGGR